MKFRKIPLYKFWRTALLVLAPFLMVNLLSLSVTTRTPEWWLVFGYVVAGLVVFLIVLYVFFTDRQRRGPR